MSTSYVNVQPSDHVVPSEKFRVTFQQSDVEVWLNGNQMPYIYSKLATNDALVFAVSEPPPDNDRVMVLDVQVRMDAPSVAVSELLNDLSEIAVLGLADVTRLEKLDYGVAPTSQIGDVYQTALEDQKNAGLSGVVNSVKNAASNAVKSTKGILIAGAVLAGAIALILLLKTAKEVEA